METKEKIKGKLTKKKQVFRILQKKPNTYTEQLEIVTVEGYLYSVEGIEFCIIKNKNNYYEMYEIHTGLNACNGEKTIKAIIGKFETFIENDNVMTQLKGIKTMDSLDTRIEKQNKFFKLHSKYTELTGKVLPLMSFMLSVDVIKLDKEENVPDGISLQDHIKNKYGEQACNVLEELVDMKI